LNQTVTIRNKKLMSNTQLSSEALIIFVRNPELGKVKTRLAKSVGDEKALEIYKALLDHARETVLQVNVNRLLFYVDRINQNDDWSKDNFSKIVQEGEGLGDRMHHSFVVALKQHEKAVIVGSDIPQINANIIKEAFEKLDDHPFVIGPAIDGGYYLLGMRSPTPELFDDMVWSTPDVFDQTIKRMQNLGGTWHELPTLSDIDYIEDWEKYGWELKGE
jgi:rSAM/selenodomain-associated transferase 1